MTRILSKSNRLFMPLAVIVALLAGSPRHAPAAEQVTYLLPAPAFLPAFGPWMLAQHKGYFAGEGLEVTFQSAKGGVDVAKQVGAGNAVIGGGIGDTPVIVRPNGIPVKAVAVLGGGSLMQLVINKDKGISTIADLKGKTITTMSYQDTTYYALLGMLATQGMTKADVNAQAAGPANVWKLFLAGESDAMAAVPDWTGIALGKGMNLEIIPSDAHFRSMSQAILASDEVIAKQPELVAKLVRATLRGMRDIMADPDAAAVAYVEAVPQHQGKEQAMAGVFKLYNQYVYPTTGQLGAMDAERLSALQDFYHESGFIRAKTAVDELYTNQFVEAQ